MSETLSDLTREDRINAIAEVVIEAALCEAMAFLVGPKTVVTALERAIEIIRSIEAHTEAPAERLRRLNELRAWLGMAAIPDAAATRVNGHAAKSLTRQ